MAEDRGFASFIDELKQRTDIVDVIGSYIPVKQKGRSFWANCPFHHEKTPSFSISRDGQFYKCFGCGVSGDVIKFVEEYESVGFMEAVEILASRIGLKVPVASKENDSELKEKRNRRDRLLALLKDAAVFYNKVLLSDYGKKAVEYLRGRGIDRRIITAYGLGYSPDYDSLIEYLRKKGYSDEEMKASGTANVNKSGRLYDVLYERVIVPIVDSRKEVLAFGGRIIEKRSDFAKYKNTQETEVFVKSKNLYNINTIKALKQSGRLTHGVIMTEGYMDVIGLGSVGIENVCASMGTSLTEEQARLLKRFTDEVYICYDGDGAGQNATIRGMDILSGEGLTVRVMTLPDGLDPDELIRQRGKSEFEGLLNEARPLMDYKLELLRKKYDMNASSMAKREENRIEFSKRAGKLIATITDKVERRMYADKIAAESGLSADFLEQSDVAAEEQFEIPTFTNKINRQQKAMAFVAAVLFAGKSYADRSFIPEGGGECEDKVFSYIKNSFERGVQPDIGRIYDVAGAELFVSAVVEADTDKPEAERYYADCVKMLKRDTCDREIQSIRDRIPSCSEAEQYELMKRISKLLKERNGL